MNRRSSRTILFVAIFVFFCSVAVAQESVLDAESIAGDAESFGIPSSEAFELPPTPEKAPWDWRKELSESTPFIRDTTLKLNLRSFYFARQDGADDSGNDKEKISWALGGSAALKTGKLYDVFSIGSELFTSQKLYGPDDKDGALLLEPGQEGYTVIGVANPRFDYEGQALSLYRQRHEFPYVNSQENRMTPNTFESYSYGYLGEGDKPRFQFGAGYIDKIKKRNSDTFVSMSEGAGVTNGDRGMPWAGVRFRPTDDIKITAVNFAGLDYLNFFYTDAEHVLKFSDDWSLKSAVQFSEQRSIGDDLLTGGTDVSVGMWGVQEALSFQNFMVRAAVTVNDEGRTLIAPYGSYPGFNSSIVEDFNRAGEVAWKVGLSYDFIGVGVDGLSAYVDYIQGDGAVSDSKESLPDKSETDFNVDYRIKEGLLKSFWLRFRTGLVHEDSVGTTKDFRIILNYEVRII